MRWLTYYLIAYLFNHFQRFNVSTLWKIQRFFKWSYSLDYLLAWQFSNVCRNGLILQVAYLFCEIILFSKWPTCLTIFKCLSKWSHCPGYLLVLCLILQVTYIPCEKLKDSSKWSHSLGDLPACEKIKDFLKWFYSLGDLLVLWEI